MPETKTKLNSESGNFSRLFKAVFNFKTSIKKAKAGRRSGFTLIELLIASSIIALLSTMIMTSLASARVAARDARREADMRQLVTALSLWYQDHGSFPCTVFQDSTSNTFMEFLVDNKYIGDTPIDPLNTNDPFEHYEFATYKSTSGGACGQIAYLGMYFENTTKTCPAGGVATNIPGHCHIFYPTPLLACPLNPYDMSSLPETCPNSLSP